MMSHDPDWIAADWGSTRLRLWAMAADGTRLAERSSQPERAPRTPTEFETILRALAGDWLERTGTIVACGMLGAREGWLEAPYRPVPCAVAPAALTRAPVAAADTRPALSLHVVSGLRQATPPDVMRGEETQIAGFLAKNDGWDGVICLPGTHTKWAHVSAGEVVSFQTFMTGELFALLSEQSILRHGVAEAGWDADAFADALSDTISRPEKLAGKLFALRGGHLLDGMDPATARARLSGLLIGAELAAAKPYWLGQNMALIGTDAVAHPYAEGLAAQGVTVLRADADDMTLAGLRAAHAQLAGA